MGQQEEMGFRGRLAWFIHSEVTGSVVLLTCTVLALALANSPWADDYGHLLHTPVGVSWGDASFRLSLHHWINDGLMALFFFVVGLEIKRELLVGRAVRRSARRALPVAAALGGMVVPGPDLPGVQRGRRRAPRGWGMPMATDIAFALGVLALLGARVPLGAEGLPHRPGHRRRHRRRARSSRSSTPGQVSLPWLLAGRRAAGRPLPGDPDGGTGARAFSTC